ncbi:MAG TPA: rhodanese-like domain-containing protein [Burkholderiaceae bacterium]|uniref:rhodanese-like domain-containing protein n=1 Tax=Candidatus Skiveiella danica TaxID=3386177 RepID=UPI001B6F7738|nr:rhodanese-like domain-containing protein [Comamonadaceae bacterium]MBK9198478.1 rhodanese-like domain-containing protein [Betaproteobacteria bacterium]MBP6308200.1 rhodanese-like domain-containing protein [Burkholderiaceae bacterium]MBK6558354.1 rhodanese-like domain-containing protein [Comamonadaceae bacterium]MBK6929013.1 rhodanese-like domain-containing protein [Comamonadaceae bacterium]
MKFLLDNWMLIAVALMSAGMLAWPVITGGGGPGTVTAAGAVQLINREKAVVVDVCEAGEYASGHVAGARHAPLGELEQKLPGLVKNKATPVILVCASGARSGRAVSIARKLGYEQALSLSGGMRSWRDANLPVEKA